MANFTTHIAVGTVVSGALATLTLAADVISQEHLVAVTLAGVLGSILPDIDLKDSRPSRALFAGLGIFFSFAVLFACAGRYSIAELWILWLGTLVGVRYGVHAVFHRIAVHRGIWHSLLALAFVTILTAVAFKYILGAIDGVAWLGGAFMGIGYLTHLVLDELYSVDVMDTRFKASFGTALKLVDVKNWRHSLAMAAATVAVAMIAPPTTTFVDGITSRQLWAGLQHKLLPHDKWFGLVQAHRAIAQLPEKASPPAAAPVPLTTGSLPERAPAAAPFRTIAADAEAMPPAAAPIPAPAAKPAR
jgi:LexA-binding, inner membrane-associated putative hydrolase